MSQDLYDLLNIPDSPDQQLFTPDPGDQPHDDSGSASVPHSPTPFTLPPASKKSFQKDILRLMMDGIKISLVRRPSPKPSLNALEEIAVLSRNPLWMVMIPQGSTGRGGAPHHQWRRILWSCRDTFRVQIGRLLVHSLSPSLPLSDRKDALEFVFDARHLDILKECLSPGLEVSVTERYHLCLSAASAAILLVCLSFSLLQLSCCGIKMRFINVFIILFSALQSSGFTSGQMRLVSYLRQTKKKF